MPGFELKGKVSLDGSKWQAGLNQAKRHADSWSSETAKMIRGRLVQAFAVGALWRGATGLLEKAAEIRDRSTRIGVDPEEFQTLDYAARQSGASIDDVSAAIRTLARVQQDATEGNKDALAAFDRFGLSFDDLAQRAPIDVFYDVAKAVEEGKNQMNLLADAQTLLGRGGQALIPVFQSNFSGMVQEARNIGAPLTNQQVSEMGQTADALTKAQQEGASIFGKSFQALSDFVAKYGAFAALPFDRDARQSVFNAERLQSQLDNKLLEQMGSTLKSIDENTRTLKQ